MPTPASRQEVSYSIPVFATGIGAVVRKDRIERVQRPRGGAAAAHQPAVHLLVVAGTRVEQAVIERLRAQQLDVKPLPVKDFNAGIDAVTVQRADAFFADRVTLLDTVKRGPRAGELQVLERYFTHDDARASRSRAATRTFASPWIAP